MDLGTQLAASIADIADSGSQTNNITPNPTTASLLRYSVLS